MRAAFDSDEVLTAMGQRREVGGNGANQYKSNGATVSPLQKTTADIASEAGVSKRTAQQQKRHGTSAFSICGRRVTRRMK